MKIEEEPDIPVAEAQPVSQPAVVQTQAFQPQVQAQLPGPAPQMVEVVAPTDLAAGYQFNVDAGGGKLLVVQVPAGGVRQGQKFHAPVVGGGAGTGSMGHSTPTGRWRDGLCDCCEYGCCHAACCLGCWCGLCLMGQVLQRMKMDWLSRPNPTAKNAFKIWFAITTVWIVVYNIMSFIIQSGTEEVQRGSDTVVVREDWAEALLTAYNIILFAFFLLTLIVLCQLRQKVRAKYNIPTQCCGGCEDCCCAYWCSPCTVCQLARHTADYNRYPAQCCTATGLDSQAPECV